MEHVLLHLVGLRRPFGSVTEARVIPYLLEILRPHGIAMFGPHIDGAGNLHLDLRSEVEHRTLFVAHTDTVHGQGGRNKFIATPDTITADGAPLGADDAAGVAILCAMIEADVPGYYIFTRGEEVGGHGSKYLAKNHFGLLSEFDRAIAFDRKGTSDVITWQGACGKCASNEFAYALSDALNEHGLMYVPNDTGMYTDTAEFTYLIQECTNISVGYTNEHTDKETLDLVHWRMLRDAALSIEWDVLPTVRQHSDDGRDDWPVSAEFLALDGDPDFDDPNDPFYVGPCH